MDLLIIGNGFDIAHGLPTKYEHFLKFVKAYKNYESDTDDEQVISGSVNLVSTQKEIFAELNQLITNNTWLEYFINVFESRIIEGKEGWIDFESEISKIIQLIDKDIKKAGNNIYTIVKNDSNYCFLSYFLDELKGTKTYNDLIMTLEDDLNRLIRVLEIYLTGYVGNIDCNLISPNIKKIVDATNQSVKVISFNYTDTYERIYLDELQRLSSEKLDYIHGKAKINNSLESNNMVLGIDEYLKKIERNKRLEFISFKKYYQRIYKKTGCKYKEWINEIIRSNSDHKDSIRLLEKELEKNRGMGNEGYVTKQKLKQLKGNPPQHNLHIFGHSLDVTDKDILKELILNDNVHTTIYYFNKKIMGQQIANLVKVIGQDELIRRTGARIIEFKQQADMVKK